MCVCVCERVCVCVCLCVKMVEIVHTTRRVVSAEERKGAADRQAQQRAKLGLPLAFGAGFNNVF